MKEISVGNQVSGEIILKSEEYVFVDLGQKKDGILPVKSLNPDTDLNELKMGDQITAFVSKIASDSIELSQVINKKKIDFADIKNAYEQKIPVKGKVVETCKGGFRIKIMGKMGFCPISQIDQFFVDDPEAFVNKELYFFITDFEAASRNIIVSHKQYLLHSAKEKWKKIHADWLKDSSIEFHAKVLKVQDKGIVVQLDNQLTAFLPTSEVSMTHIDENKEKLAQQGQFKIRIKKINISDERQGAIVTLAEYRKDSWQGIMERFTIGQVVQGQIVQNVRAGVLIELEENFNAFLPNSEINRCDYLSAKELAVNSLLDVRIKDIDPVKRQVILSLPEKGSEQDWQQYKQDSSTGFKPFQKLFNQ